MTSFFLKALTFCFNTWAYMRWRYVEAMQCLWTYIEFFSEIIISYCMLDRLKAAYISFLVLEYFKYGMPLSVL